MACLLPQAHKGQFEERTLEAEGSPETQPARLPQGSGGSSHQLRAGLIALSARRRRFLKLFCPPRQKVELGGGFLPPPSVTRYVDLRWMCAEGDVCCTPCP